MLFRSRDGLPEMSGDFNILLVSADPALAKDVREAVRDSGYHLAGIISRSDDIETMLAEFSPDLILVDAGFAENPDGDAVTASLGSLTKRPLVIIYDDGEGIRMDVQDFLPAGILFRPFSGKALLTVLSLALEHHKKVETLKDMVNTLPDVVYEIDDKGRIVYISEGIKETFGYAPDEFNNARDVFMLFTPEDRERAAANFMKTIGGTPGQEEEYSIRKKDGSIVPVSFIANPVMDGAVCRGTRGVVRDITKRRMGEIRLKESEEKYRTLVENINEVHVILNGEGNIVYVSPAVKSFVRYGIDDIIGKHYSSFVCPDDLSSVRKMFNATLAGERCIAEYRVVDVDGECLWVRISTGLMERNGVVRGVSVLLTDINDRKKAEEDLRISEKRYRALFEGAVEGIVVIDSETHIMTYANPAFCRMLGYPEEELGMMRISEIHPVDRRGDILQDFLHHTEGKKTYTPNVPCIRKDGTMLYADIHSTTIIINDKKHQVGFFTDVTKREWAEREIYKLSSAMRQSIDGIAICELDQRISFANDSFAGMHGFNPAEMLDMPLSALYDKGLMDDFSLKIKKVLATGRWQGETLHVKNGGTPFPVFMSLSLLRESFGGPAGILVVCRDITEKKHLEKEIIHISEKERIRMGQDLHDGIGQYFTGLGYLFRTLIDTLPDRSREVVEASEEITNLIGEAKKHVQMLSKGYYPVSMDKKGIIIAVDELCSHTEYMFDITCTFVYGEDIVINDNETATHVYYIINEAVNNAVKHGKARNILIMMEKGDDSILVSVEDDGIGIDETREDSSGLGLNIMRYRASIIGGVLKIVRGQTRGTIVNLMFPNH